MDIVDATSQLLLQNKLGQGYLVSSVTLFILLVTTFMLVEQEHAGIQVPQLYNL